MIVSVSKIRPWSKQLKKWAQQENRHAIVRISAFVLQIDAFACIKELLGDWRSCCIPLVLTVCNILIIFATTVWPFVIFFLIQGALDEIGWCGEWERVKGTALVCFWTTPATSALVPLEPVEPCRERHRTDLSSVATPGCRVATCGAMVPTWCRGMSSCRCIGYMDHGVIGVAIIYLATTTLYTLWSVQSSRSTCPWLESERCHQPRAHANDAINTIDAELTTIQTKELASVPELWFTALVIQ